MKKDNTRKKRLNIYNTDRYFNMNLMKRSAIEKSIKVTRLNEKEIEEEMDKLAEGSTRFNKKNKKSYLLYQEKYTNDRLIQKLFAHGGSVTYYTNSIIPYYVIKHMAQSTTSKAVYSVKKEFTEEQVKNIELTKMATTVIIDVPVVVPDVSPYDVLFSLHPLKTDVDGVQFSFPRLGKSEIQKRHLPFYELKGKVYELRPEIKYEYVKYTQVSLSIWGMYLWLVCNSEEDFQEIDKLLQKDLKRRDSGRRPSASQQLGGKTHA
ncbi:hypothetical protein [Listeria phage P100plus]|uniref:Synaptonemal complex 1 (SCP-1) domain containing protein n=18 Tax=Pecentumvirus TaxID=1857844 RepID=S4U874_9CAUD|nr:hypothetical protein AG2_128 [Listeria phage vB_LmoM_AG20]YP_008240115.1 synaptonemal complex 1 (SCP-1) domain containing protein [Listeria phage LP-125]YP_009042942.1 synaptonemal complex 1 (SCP-1) domain-containing protein [Listeria phage LP-048]YP_009043143.1 synaptonemal complex 1 (SCP-1) domain containing protein [Listeria phage LMSP-25]YP_009044605.1 synaptonemal complex 1 (SCP-1) domain-containing protein [Listeria phage LP-083-2]YP_009592682.1 synaptonemal complex 1 (SCP-1) domain-c